MNRVARREELASKVALAPPDAALRILLGEDNRQMRHLLAMLLRREGHDVIEAGDGAEVLEALSTMLLERERYAFDLVIAEASLPGIPGLAILAGMRAWDHATPFVLIGGNPEVQRQARNLGAAILEHPINLQGLRDALAAPRITAR